MRAHELHLQSLRVRVVRMSGSYSRVFLIQSLTCKRPPAALAAARSTDRSLPSPTTSADAFARCLQVCLTYVASNLSAVICTQEYKRLTESCHGMVEEILAAVAKQNSHAVAAPAARPPAHRALGVPGVRRQARRRDGD